MSRRRIVCLVGPTASGKTALALQIAAQSPVEIVSADSRQVYRGLDIGTAKPSPAEQAAVPHHGLDVIEPSATFDAGHFARMATNAIAAAHARGRDVLIVGGTGLYVRALLRGLSPMPPRAERLRGVLNQLAARDGAPFLHRWLRVLDPPTATRVHPNDTARIVRGLEVAFGTGRRWSEWRALPSQPPAWDAVMIGVDVPVATLDARILARTETMLAAGWLDEVAHLTRTTTRSDPAWRTVGYRELRAVVDGQTSLSEARDDINRATRQFAKRQRTWFRHEPTIQWRAAHQGTEQDVVAEVLSLWRA